MNHKSKSQIAKILSEFQGSIFNHPNSKAAFDDLTAALSASLSPQIIILTGPTGVGKSTLAKAARNRLLNQYADEMRDQSDFVPVVSINAVPPNGPSFGWKDFYIRVLTGQNEPLVKRKLFIPMQQSLFFEHQINASPLQQTATDDLRRSFEEYMRHRRSKLLIIDEAHHMFLGKNQEQSETLFETLKSFTIESGITILLVGTYRLLDILDQSGQLARRSQVVHFPRYDMRISNDRDHFRQVLVHMEQLLSSYVPTKLDVHADRFYRKTVGCVGILKDWLGSCLEYGLQENISLIDSSFAERFSLANHGLIRIAKEAFAGEYKLADVSDERLEDLLTNGIVLSGDHHEPPKNRRRPGKRKAVRDPVGQISLW